MEQNLQNVISPPAPLIAPIEAPKTSISDDINAATREPHAVLNRLIIARLPLALPPKASDPGAYAQGIASFAGIYYAFEQIWDDVIEAADRMDANFDSHDAQLLRCLATLRPPGLARTERLSADLEYLREATAAAIDKPSRAHERVIRRMRKSLRNRPHTLVAYAWVMYMALFSGGRWIRQQLTRAGPDFWEGKNGTFHEKQSVTKPETPGFSFLTFDDGNDGNDIKAAFKSRLADAETLLSERERQDVIAEAQALFKDCIALVGILDRRVGTEVVRSRLTGPFGVTAVLLVIVCLLWLGRSYWMI